MTLSFTKGEDSTGVREIRLDHYEDPVGRLSIDSAKGLCDGLDRCDFAHEK